MPARSHVISAMTMGVGAALMEALAAYCQLAGGGRACCNTVQNQHGAARTISDGMERPLQTLTLAHEGATKSVSAFSAVGLPAPIGVPGVLGACLLSSRFP